MSSTQSPVESKLLSTWPPSHWSTTRVLVGVSGGADSVALLRALLQVAEQPRLIDVAHFNHCLRGDESDREAEFVRALCEQLRVRAYVGRADQVQGEPVGRSEEAARDARYEFLSAVAYQTGARYVAVAHNSDDRIETLLHNLFRGTGLAGVCSLAASRPLDRELVLVRPLLNCSRNEIVAYLADLEQSYCTDSSNADESYKRNFLRQRVLPSLREEYGESVGKRLLGFSDTAAEVEELLGEMAANYLAAAETAAREASSYGVLPTLDRTLFAFPVEVALPVQWPVLQKALSFVWLDRQWPLGKMTREHWQQLRRIHATPLNDDEPSTRSVKHENLPGALKLETRGDWVLISGF